MYLTCPTSDLPARDVLIGPGGAIEQVAQINEDGSSGSAGISIPCISLPVCLYGRGGDRAYSLQGSVGADRDTVAPYQGAARDKMQKMQVPVLLYPNASQRPLCKEKLL